MAAAKAYEKSVLFVCLGNICRSPIAEAIFNHLLEEKGLAGKWLVDSCAIGPWHVGSRPDARAITVLRSKEIKTNHRARQLNDRDFDVFDYIFGMDEQNIADIERVKPKNSKAIIELLGKYDPAGELIIDDPYYSHDDRAFYKTLEQCRRCCEGFLKSVL